MKKGFATLVVLGILLATFATTTSVYAEAPLGRGGGNGGGNSGGKPGFSADKSSMPNNFANDDPRDFAGDQETGPQSNVPTANPASPNAPGQYKGILQDGMLTYYAETLGLSVEELNAQLTAGETLYSLVTAAGYTQDEFIALKVAARTAALAQAVADGLITQEQADWWSSHQGILMNQGRGMYLGGGQSIDPPCLPTATPTATPTLTH